MKNVLSKTHLMWIGGIIIVSMMLATPVIANLSNETVLSQLLTELNQEQAIIQNDISVDTYKRDTLNTQIDTNTVRDMAIQNLIDEAMANPTDINSQDVIKAVEDFQ